jgi:hypothetical protein
MMGASFTSRRRGCVRALWPNSARRLGERVPTRMDRGRGGGSTTPSPGARQWTSGWQSVGRINRGRFIGTTSTDGCGLGTKGYAPRAPRDADKAPTSSEGSP